MFLEVVSGGRIAAVELMSDLLPLRRSGSFRLAISSGNWHVRNERAGFGVLLGFCRTLGMHIVRADKFYSFILLI
jgi:hypothetical protein